MKPYEFDTKYDLAPPLMALKNDEKVLYVALDNFLQSFNVPRDEYAVGIPDCNERLCFHLDNQFWTVYYSERGLRTFPSFFSNYHDAANYFVWELISNSLKFPRLVLSTAPSAAPSTPSA